MLNVLVETSKYYFHHVVFFALCLFMITTLVRAEPKTIRLTAQEMSMLSMPKKCSQISLKTNGPTTVTHELIEMEGVGGLSFNHLLNSNPLKLVFGIINLNNEGKSFEVILQQDAENKWSQKTTLYGLQATKKVIFQVTQMSIDHEKDNKKNFFEITLLADSLKFKGKTYTAITFLCR